MKKYPKNGSLPKPAGRNGALKDKHILISGGTTGIGRATALLLANEGAKVFVFGRHKRELADVLKDAQGCAGSVFGITADQAEPEGVDKVFTAVSKKFPHLDVLVNNAGIGGNDITADSDEGMMYTVKSNLLGYLYCARRAIKLMKQRKSGHIVNVGSINAETMEEGGEIYTATKSAIRAFSKSLRKTLKDSGIKVSLIEPGMTGTDMLDEDSKEQQEKEAKLEMLKAEDIADAVHYCLTRSSRVVVTSIQVEPLCAED